MKTSFHTDAFNNYFVFYDRCLEWAHENDVHWIEHGLIHSLGS